MTESFTKSSNNHQNKSFEPDTKLTMKANVWSIPFQSTQNPIKLNAKNPALIILPTKIALPTNYLIKDMQNES